MNNDNKGQVLIDIHLYDNVIETFIKNLIWIFSWLGGIFVLLDSENKEVLGNAYFIYTISLLMEFVPMMYKKTQFLNRLLYMILCFIMSIVCAFSASILMGHALSDWGYAVMRILTFVVIIYMWIDFGLWAVTPNSNDISSDNKTNKEADNRQSEFSNRLKEGNLGRIDGGADNNE